ncbi:MAG: DUF4058 family protein [Pirellulales bacterium]
MPSPFPGMDVYLEDPAFWPDFRARFITYWCDSLRELLPAGYEARVDERVNLVEMSPPASRQIGPDVLVSHADAPGAATRQQAIAGTLEPASIPLLIQDGIRETYIEILQRPERSIVAVLELLSPSNKENPGRALYLAKRNTLLHEDVHLVELDLLLGGRRLPLAAEYPPGDYFALVSRADRRPICDVYGWTIRQVLPKIPIPLRAPDADISIDLELVFTLNYDRGGYGRSLRYGEPPRVGLPPDNAAWAAQRVRLGARAV